MSDDDFQPVMLTADEWLSLLDGDRDGLPRCCANISALRDDIIMLVRNGGQADPFTLHSIKRHITWCFPEHGDPSPPLQKILDQFDITPYEDEGLSEAIEQSYSKRHERMRMEFG